MKKIKSIFFGGVKVLVPLLVTLLLIYWGFTGFERLFRGVFLFFLDSSYYFSGLGWISALIIAILFGLLLQVTFMRKATQKLSKLFFKLPVIKPLYDMSSDIMMFLTKKGMKQGKIVKFETPLGRMVGIVTQEDMESLPDGIGKKDELAVYVPMSYQIGGFTFIVPKDSVEPVDVSVQKGIALTMSAFISGKR